MKIKIILLSVLSCMLIGLTGCMSPGPEPEGRLYVRTLIDGKDTLYIRGDSMWFVHHAYQLPGQWAGENLPTYINQEQEWMIEWNGTLSDVIKIEKPESTLPDYGEWNSENMMVKFYTPSYGEAAVREYPTAENDYTLVIALDDVEPHGAHWFYIDIDWDDTSR